MDSNNSDDEVLSVRSQDEQIQETERLLEDTRLKSARHQQNVERRKRQLQKIKKMRTGNTTGARLAMELHTLYICRRRVRDTKSVLETSLRQLKESTQKLQNLVSRDCQRYIELCDGLALSQQRYPIEHDEIDEFVYRC